MVGNILSADPPPPDLEVENKGLNSTFLEHGNVAYQIKGNHECSAMVFAHRTPYPGDEVRRSKVNFSQNMVMLHIKLKRITRCNSMVANSLPTYPSTPLRLSGMGSKDQNYFFIQNMVILHIKLKGITNAATW